MSTHDAELRLSLATGLRNPYTLTVSRDAAINEAATRSDANGAPVAVVTRDGWFRIVEDAEEYEALCDEGWASVAVLDPDTGERT